MPPPARATLERITAERVDLYSYVPSPGDNIPVTVRPVKVDDSVHTEDEIEEAVKNLRSNRYGGIDGNYLIINLFSLFKIFPHTCWFFTITFSRQTLIKFLL